jgi:hypothetical protein
MSWMDRQRNDNVMTGSADSLIDFSIQNRRSRSVWKSKISDMPETFGVSVQEHPLADVAVAWIVLLVNRRYPSIVVHCFLMYWLTV